MRIAFSTQSPTILQVWHETQQMIVDWQHKTSDFAAHYGGTPARLQRTGILSLVGIYTDQPTEGEWIFDKHHNFWKPNRRFKTGREIHDEMEELVVHNLRFLPGMPDIAFENGRWYEASIGEYDGTLWVGWDCPIEVLRDNIWSRIDLSDDLWTQQPLSSYYLALEAHEKEQACSSPSSEG